MRGGGAGHPDGGRPGPAASLPGGLGAGRPSAGRPVLQGLARKFSAKFFAEKPLPPRSAAGVYSYKFRKQKYIFGKNKIEKYKNKKTAAFKLGDQGAGGLVWP